MFTNINDQLKKIPESPISVEDIILGLIHNIQGQIDLEVLIELLIKVYPKNCRPYLKAVRSKAISAGMNEYEDYLVWEKLVDECKIRCDRAQLSYFYNLYENASSLMEKSFYKHKIKSQFKTYIKNEKQFEELYQDFLSSSTDSPAPQLTTLDDFQDNQEDKFLVQNLVQKTGLALLTGSAKIGKSSLGCDIAYSVATGNPLFNHPTNQGKVLVVSLDESKTETQLKYLTRGFNKLENHQDKLKFLWDIRNLTDLEKSLKEYRPSLIIFDSLEQLTSRFNISENSSKLGRFLKNLKTLLEKYSCVGLIIHHANKSKSSNSIAKIRGSSAIAASTAVNLFLETKNNQIILTATGRDIITSEYKLNLNARENWETMGAYSRELAPQGKREEATDNLLEGKKQPSSGKSLNTVPLTPDALPLPPNPNPRRLKRSTKAQQIKKIIHSYGKITKDEIIQEAVKIAISQAQVENYLNKLEKSGEILAQRDTTSNNKTQLFNIYYQIAEAVDQYS